MNCLNCQNCLKCLNGLNDLNAWKLSSGNWKNWIEVEKAAKLNDENAASVCFVDAFVIACEETFGLADFIGVYEDL